MYPIYCFMFSHPLSDDVRDLLFQVAYLMLKDNGTKRKVRSDFCEGVVTRIGSVILYGIAGIQFDAQIETEKGNLKVSYMVRTQDLHILESEDAEYGAWLSPDEILNPPADLEQQMRPNPIRKVSKVHKMN